MSVGETLSEGCSNRVRSCRGDKAGQTNQTVCQITDDRHQELLEIGDIRLAHRPPRAMDDLVKCIE